MRSSLVIISILIITSCQSHGDRMNTWIGASEEMLVSQWGPPSSVYMASPKTKILTYSQRGGMVWPGSSGTTTTTVVGNTAYSNTYGAYPAQNIQLVCDRHFTINSGKITNISWNGNACR